MLQRRFCLVLSLVIVSTGYLTANADNWPGFRGATGSGVSSESNLPSEWSESKNLLWHTKLPGLGNSSPCVTSDRIYLTSRLEGDESLWVMAIDRFDGSIIWKKRVGSGEIIGDGPPGNYRRRHNAATPTTSADESHVWAYFGTGHLVCLSKSGEIAWQRNLAEDYGDYDIKFGMGSSPRLWGDLLYVSCMHKGPSYVLALNKLTGEEVWMTMRNLPAIADGPDAYGTPMVLQYRGQTELFVAGSGHIDGYNLQTGKRLWISSGLTVEAEYGRMSSSAAISENVIFAGAAGKRQGIALRTGGKGDITESGQLWEAEKVTDCPTPVCYDGLVYALRDDGVCACYDLETGKLQWRKRIGGKNLYRSSPVAGDGKVYFTSLEGGQCTVFAAGSKGKEIAKNILPIIDGDDGRFFSIPAISDGIIYFRGRDRLYAVGNESSASGKNLIVTNAIGMRLVEIPTGEFLMGGPKTETGARDDERPVHKVRFSKPLLVGQYEVTQAEFEKVMGTNPSWFSASGRGKAKIAGLDTGRFPVENMTWREATEFCQKLSALPEEKAAGRVYRLPTEAEWQYVCRGGTSTAFHYGDGLSSHDANILGIYPHGGAPKGPSLMRPAAVGSYAPNAFGLYDMHGNVYELLQDWYGRHYYETSPEVDPLGPEAGKDRMMMGGSWNTDAYRCRSAFRRAVAEAGKAKYSGFRIVAEKP